MEDFLKSLRDLEEDLEEALIDLDHYGPPPSGTGDPGQSLPKLLTQDRLNQFGWRMPREGAPKYESEDDTGSGVDLTGPQATSSDEAPEEFTGDEAPEDCTEGESLSDDSGFTGSGSGSRSGSGCVPHHHHHHPHRFPCPPPPPRICGTQVIVNGTLTIPETKPDAEMILRFMPVCKVTDWQCVHTIEGRKIVVTGLVEIGVEYVADAPEQPVHFVHFVVPYHTFFLCEKPLKGVTCEVEFKHAELLNPRTISKVILLMVRGLEA